MKDVARVEMGARSQDRYSRFNGAPAAALGIYQTPGSNAVDVTRQVREAMDTLATRFPEDLAYNVFFDSTVFVTATIEEVVRTLVEAFVLVALVVFLFLGKLRTTLIPLVAVPVSIIGTFAVMLAIGYSANTVSLLALVLAIGIVVDDAIVVVENVERVIEEEPELSVPERLQEGDGRDHRPDHRHHAGPAVGLRPRGLHPRHQRPAVPPIRGGGLGIDADLGAQCPDPEPGAVRGAAEARPERAAGRCATCWARIDQVRDGYVAVVRRLVRVAIVGVVVVAGVLAASAWLFSKTPQSFLPDEDQGAFFAAMRLPEGASINRTEAVVKQVEDIVRPIPGVEGVLSVVGLNFIDYVASSNQAFFVIRLKPYEERTDRAQSAGAIIARLRPQMAAIQGAIAFPFNLPPILGLGSTGGFQYVLEALQGQSPTDLAATLRGLLVAANGQPELAGVFSTYAADTPQIYLDIDRDKAQVLGVKISDIFNALQSTLGRLLRQRLQPVRPHLAGQHPGRDAVPRQRRRHLPDLCAQRPGRHGADPGAGRGEAGAGAADGDPLQRLPRRDRQRRAEARLQLRPGARRDGAHLGHDPAGRLRLRMDRHGAAGKGGERPTGIVLGARHPLRLSVSRRALRELEHPGPGAAVGQRRRARRASSRWRWPD